MQILGIESTAHTFGVGIFDSKKDEILANKKSYYKTPPGEGITPRLASEHHSANASKTIFEALRISGLGISDIDAIAYSAGPGLGPCLQTGAAAASFIASKFDLPLIPVNHPFAHISIGEWQCGMRDPLILYVSGGNTQIITKEKGRYSVLGETLDIGVGNLLDSFARELDFEFAHGGEVAKKASRAKKYHLMPYTVKGMNFAFSGLFTYAVKKKGMISDEDLCYSLMETAYCELCEALERALMLRGKKEILVCGGVAQSRELMAKVKIMAEENKVRADTCSAEYNADNGAMIAYAGFLDRKKSIDPLRAWIDQKWRIDSPIA